MPHEDDQLQPPVKNSQNTQHTQKQYSSHREAARALSVLQQVGISIITCIALGLAAGYFLDKWLGTSPWLLIVCIIFGIIAALKSILDFAKRQ